MAVQQERDALFHKLLLKKDNKHCFACGTNNPKWTSKTFGVFVYLDCSGIHRSMGVHLVHQVRQHGQVDERGAGRVSVLSGKRQGAPVLRPARVAGQRARADRRSTPRAPRVCIGTSDEEVAALHKGRS